MFVEFHSYIPSTGKFVPVIDGTILKGNRYNGANNTSPFWDLPMNVSKDSFVQLQNQLHRGNKEHNHSKLTITPVEMHTMQSSSHSPPSSPSPSSPSPTSPLLASPQGLYSMETASVESCGPCQPSFESSLEGELVSNEYGSFLWDQEQLPEPLFAQSGPGSPTMERDNDWEASSTSSLEDPETNWEALKIIGEETIDEKVHYMVAWKPTLEPESNLPHLKELIADWKARKAEQQQRQQGGQRRKIRIKLRRTNQDQPTKQVQPTEKVNKRPRGRPRKDKRRE